MKRRAFLILLLASAQVMAAEIVGFAFSPNFPGSPAGICIDPIFSSELCLTAHGEGSRQCTSEELRSITTISGIPTPPEGEVYSFTFLRVPIAAVADPGNPSRPLVVDALGISAPANNSSGVSCGYYARSSLGTGSYTYGTIPSGSVLRGALCCRD